MQKFPVFFIMPLIIIAGLGVYWYVPMGQPGPETEFMVAKGEALRSVGERLTSQSVIPAVTPFIIWMKATGTSRKVQAGRFLVCSNEGVRSVSKKLLKAIPVEDTVVIPEGMTIEQTAGRAASALDIDSAVFARRCYDPEFTRLLGIPASSLEGYLFPQTYRVAPGISPESLIVRMVTEFKIEYGKIGVMTPEARDLGMHRLVTLASIVEKEAVLAQERSRIAGVFWNRLRKREPLGADPTVRYIFRKFSGPLLVSELRTDNPYNTRARAGLPPGPICSPGLAALAATANPMKTSELYFVARWDGSGAHDFSVTGAEHNRKKMQIRQENEKRIRNSSDLREGG